jgi:hypothetical protein
MKSLTIAAMMLAGSMAFANSPAAAPAAKPGAATADAAATTAETAKTEMHDAAKTAHKGMKHKAKKAEAAVTGDQAAPAKKQ